MEKSIKIITKYLLIFLAIFVPLREVIADYTISYIKFLPDMAIWLLFIFIIIHNRFKLNLKLYDILYIAFLAFGFVSTLINHVSILSYALQFRSITTMYILFYILRNVKLEARDYKPAIIALISVTTIIILLSFIEFFSDKCFMFPREWALSINYKSNYSRVYSLMHNPNTFATTIFMTMMLAFYCEKELRVKIPQGYYILVFTGIFLSASRSTMIAIGIFFIFLIYMCSKEKNFRQLIIKILLLGLSFGISCIMEVAKGDLGYQCSIKEEETQNSPGVNNSNSNENSSSGSNEQHGNDGSASKNDDDNNHVNSSLGVIDRWNETISGTTLKNSIQNGRIFIIRKGLEIFADNPIFGTGFGTYGSAASKMITPAMYSKYNLYKNFYSDNDYIKILVETGLIGTLLYGAFAISLLIYSFGNKYKLTMFIIFMLIGLFYNVSEMQVLCLILYMSFAFIDSNSNRKTND